MAWVNPDGNPSFISFIEYSLAGTSILRLKSNVLFILANLIIQRTADIPWAIIVAKATPGTPIPSPATNQRSRNTFKIVAISKNPRADIESPSPLSTPAKIL